MHDFTLLGGPTAVFGYGSLRWMTDPAFSPPGEYEGLVKLTGPALAPDGVAGRLRVPEPGVALDVS
jgi:hypothetical protein